MVLLPPGLAVGLATLACQILFWVKYDIAAMWQLAMNEYVCKFNFCCIIWTLVVMNYQTAVGFRVYRLYEMCTETLKR